LINDLLSLELKISQLLKVMSKQVPTAKFYKHF